MQAVQDALIMINKYKYSHDSYPILKDVCGHADDVVRRMEAYGDKRARASRMGCLCLEVRDSRDECHDQQPQPEDLRADTREGRAEVSERNFTLRSKTRAMHTKTTRKAASPLYD